MSKKGLSQEVVRGVFALALLATLWGSGGCASKNVMRVSRYEAGRELADSDWVYYLPQTVLDFGFCLEVERFTPGPYAAYSSSLLGFAARERAAETQYRVLLVSLGKHQEPDLNAPYVVQQKGSAPHRFVEMSRGGWLIPAQQLFQTPMPVFRTVQLPTLEFTDRSSEPFIDSERSVLHAVQQRDSTTFESVPVAREIAVKRTLAEKAQQAANVIFQLRKRRIDLLSGEEMPASSDGMVTILNELNRLEAVYLSLFRGVTQRDTVWHYLSFVPSRGENTAIPCRFTPTRGIVPAHEVTAKPLILHMEAEGGAAHYAVAPVLKNAYFYRSQRAVNLRLTLDGENLYEGRVPLSQAGDLLQQPVGE